MPPGPGSRRGALWVRTLCRRPVLLSFLPEKHTAVTRVRRALKHRRTQPQETGRQRPAGTGGAPYRGGICRTCRAPHSPAFPSPRPVKAPGSGQASGRCSLLSGPADRRGSPNLRERGAVSRARTRSGGREGGQGPTAALVLLTPGRSAPSVHKSRARPGEQLSTAHLGLAQV